MKFSFVGCVFLIFAKTTILAQQTGIKGHIVDAITGAYLEKVEVRLQESKLNTVHTDADGVFALIHAALPLGEHILLFSKQGYITKRFPIVIHENKILDVKKIDLEYDFSFDTSMQGEIALYEDELTGDQDEMMHMSGLLQATRDVFLKAAAFDFGATFFRPRGLGSENSKVLILSLIHI